MSDEYVNNARLIILDQKRIRHLFKALREYYAGKNVDPILNILEAALLNAVTERELFIKLLDEVLWRDETREKVMTAMRDKQHQADKELKDFEDKDVYEIIKEYFGGKDG